jgi:hypothetical protein
MEQEKPDSSGGAGQTNDANDGGNVVENIKRTLGFDDGAAKELDDEMKRPPDDRSPLT